MTRSGIVVERRERFCEEMNWVGALLTFFLSWWLIWMTVLSIGVRNAHEEKVKVGRGEDKGAPVNPRLLWRVCVTTGGALMATVVMTLAIETGVIEAIVGGALGW